MKEKSLKTYFMTGLLVSAPLAITIYFAISLISWIDDIFTTMLPPKYNPETYLAYSVPGLGVVILLLLMILIGMISSGWIGNFFLSSLNKIISKLPIISGLYSSLKKILETVLGGEQSKAFRQAVLVHFPHQDCWTIAFLTGKVYSKIQKKIGPDEFISVYVPTTPNPTSGYLVFVKKKDTIPLQIKVEDAWKIVISTGIITPDTPQKQQDALNEAIEKAKKNWTIINKHSLTSKDKK